MKCTAVKGDGSPCLASAVHADPNGHCVFHSSLTFPATKKSHEVTAQELISTIEREIRRLRKDKSLPAISRADAIRNLILVWREMSVPQVEPPPKQLTYAERVRMVEAESGR